MSCLILYPRCTSRCYEKGSLDYSGWIESCSFWRSRGSQQSKYFEVALKLTVSVNIQSCINIIKQLSQFQFDGLHYRLLFLYSNFIVFYDAVIHVLVLLILWIFCLNCISHSCEPVLHVNAYFKLVSPSFLCVLSFLFCIQFDSFDFYNFPQTSM